MAGLPPRRGRRPSRPLPPAGSLAWFDGTCPRCDQTITRHASQIVARKGEWIHTRCASGADDE